MFTVDYDPAIQSDITIGTDALSYWRFYDEARNQIWDLEKKRDLFLSKYISEMKRADIKTELSDIFIDWISDKVPTDATERKMREQRIGMLIELLFTEDFRKQHKIEYVGKTLGGYEKYNHQLKFHIGEYEYLLTCPHPRNMPEKEMKGQDAEQGVFQYRADCIHISKVNEFGRVFDCLCYPTYDWKECMVAIENHATEKANGGKIELC